VTVYVLKASLFLFIGWFLFVAPSLYILPIVISRKLADKSAELADQYRRIPFYKIDERLELTEDLLKNTENSSYLVRHFPKTFKCYQISQNIWLVIAIVLFVLTIASQVVGLYDFVRDPKSVIKQVKDEAKKIDYNK